jgi:hypothetical protein
VCYIGLETEKTATLGKNRYIVTDSKYTTLRKHNCVKMVSYQCVVIQPFSLHFRLQRFVQFKTTVCANGFTGSPVRSYPRHRPLLSERK